MMPRLLLGLTLWLAAALVACAQNEPEAAPVTSQETPGTPPAAATPFEVTRVVVEVTRVVGTAEPSPTPAECTPLPEGMTVEIIPTAAKSFTLEITGLQEHEELIIMIGGQTAVDSVEITFQPIADSVVDGRYTDHVNLSSYEIPHWQGKVIHARGVACFEFSLPLVEAGESGRVDNGRFLTAPVSSMLLSLADYPPGETPYFITEGDFWLVHTPAGQLIAFAATSPDYRPDIGLDACRFTWAESVGRFVDPCSGDEWTLDGRFSLAHSSERWSDRDLDQYRILRILEEEGTVNVQIEISKNQSADQPKGWNQSQEQTGE